MPKNNNGKELVDAIKGISKAINDSNSNQSSTIQNNAANAIRNDTGPINNAEEARNANNKKANEARAQEINAKNPNSVQGQTINAIGDIKEAIESLLTEETAAKTEEEKHEILNNVLDAITEISKNVTLTNAEIKNIAQKAISYFDKKQNTSNKDGTLTKEDIRQTLNPFIQDIIKALQANKVLDPSNLAMTIEKGFDTLNATIQTQDTRSPVDSTNIEILNELRDLNNLSKFAVERMQNPSTTATNDILSKLADIYSKSFDTSKAEEIKNILNGILSAMQNNQQQTETNIDIANINTLFEKAINKILNILSEKVPSTGSAAPINSTDNIDSAFKDFNNIIATEFTALKDSINKYFVSRENSTRLVSLGVGTNFNSNNIPNDSNSVAQMPKNFMEDAKNSNQRRSNTLGTETPKNPEDTETRSMAFSSYVDRGKPIEVKITNPEDIGQGVVEKQNKAEFNKTQQGKASAAMLQYLEKKSLLFRGFLNGVGGTYDTSSLKSFIMSAIGMKYGAQIMAAMPTLGTVAKFGAGGIALAGTAYNVIGTIDEANANYTKGENRAGNIKLTSSLIGTAIAGTLGGFLGGPLGLMIGTWIGSGAGKIIGNVISAKYEKLKPSDRNSRISELKTLEEQEEGFFAKVNALSKGFSGERSNTIKQAILDNDVPRIQGIINDEIKNIREMKIPEAQKAAKIAYLQISLKDTKDYFDADANNETLTKIGSTLGKVNMPIDTTFNYDYTALNRATEIFNKTANTEELMQAYENWNKILSTPIHVDSSGTSKIEDYYGKAYLPLIHNMELLAGYTDKSGNLIIRGKDVNNTNDPYANTRSDLTNIANDILLNLPLGPFGEGVDKSKISEKINAWVKSINEADLDKLALGNSEYTTEFLTELGKLMYIIKHQDTTHSAEQSKTENERLHRGLGIPNTSTRPTQQQNTSKTTKVPAQRTNFFSTGRDRPKQTESSYKSPTDAKLVFGKAMDRIRNKSYDRLPFTKKPEESFNIAQEENAFRQALDDTMLYAVKEASLTPFVTVEDRRNNIATREDGINNISNISEEISINTLGTSIYAKAILDNLTGENVRNLIKYQEIIKIRELLEGFNGQIVTGSNSGSGSGGGGASAPYTNYAANADYTAGGAGNAASINGVSAQISNQILSGMVEHKIGGQTFIAPQNWARSSYDRSGKDRDMEKWVANQVVDSSNAVVTSFAGWRKKPTPTSSEYHKGIDIADGKSGANVKSFMGGQVIKAGTAKGYGNIAIVRGDDGNIYRYAHLQDFNVKAGQRVEAGQSIGQVGNTGVGTGAHLHFEIRDSTDSKVIDPIEYGRAIRAMQESGQLPSGQAAQTPTGEQAMQAMPSGVGTQLGGVVRKAPTKQMQSLINRQGDYISSLAKKYNIPLDVLLGQIQQESGGNTNAVSKAGAVGLMQLMPRTAKDLGVTDRTNERQNLEAGARYMNQLMKRYKGNIQNALMAYNWGMGNVDKLLNGKKSWENVPQEAREYAGKILAKAQNYKVENGEINPNIEQQTVQNVPAQYAETNNAMQGAQPISTDQVTQAQISPEQSAQAKDMSVGTVNIQSQSASLSAKNLENMPTNGEEAPKQPGNEVSLNDIQKSQNEIFEKMMRGEITPEQALAESTRFVSDKEASLNPADAKFYDFGNAPQVAVPNTNIAPTGADIQIAPNIATVTAKTQTAADTLTHLPTTAEEAKQDFSVVRDKAANAYNIAKETISNMFSSISLPKAPEQNVTPITEAVKPVEDKGTTDNIFMSMYKGIDLGKNVPMPTLPTDVGAPIGADVRPIAPEKYPNIPKTREKVLSDIYAVSKGASSLLGMAKAGASSAYDTVKGLFKGNEEAPKVEEAPATPSAEGYKDENAKVVKAPLRRPDGSIVKDAAVEDAKRAAEKTRIIAKPTIGEVTKPEAKEEVMQPIEKATIPADVDADNPNALGYGTPGFTPIEDKGNIYRQMYNTAMAYSAASGAKNMFQGDSWLAQEARVKAGLQERNTALDNVSWSNYESIMKDKSLSTEDKVKAIFGEAEPIINPNSADAKIVQRNEAVPSLSEAAAAADNARLEKTASLTNIAAETSAKTIGEVLKPTTESRSGENTEEITSNNSSGGGVPNPIPLGDEETRAVPEYVLRYIFGENVNGSNVLSIF